MAEAHDDNTTPVADPGTPTSPQVETNKDGEISTRWKHYPLRDKVRVVEFLRQMRERDHGHPEAATIAYFAKQDPPIHLTRKTIHKWEDSREKLQKALDDEERGEPQPKKPRKSKNPAVEAQLLNFCKWAQEQNIPLTGPLLKQKLKIYQERLGGTELVGSNGWLQSFYGYYDIQLAGSKEVKKAQRALEDAEFSDDPDGKKRRLRKRRAAAKKRRARAKAVNAGLAPGEDDNDDDGDDDDDDDDDEDHQQAAPYAPPIFGSTGASAARLKPRPKGTAQNGAAASKSRSALRSKTQAGNVAQPRTTTTMQIEHLTQQQNQANNTMMQWDNGNYQADQGGDVDDSGDDDYYSAGTFGNPSATNTAIGTGWSALDTEKIVRVRTAATTLLGLALERSDVGPDNMQQSMVDVLDWCRRQEESLNAAALPPVPTRLHNVVSAYTAPAQPTTTTTTTTTATTNTTSRLPAQYATHVSTSSQPTYTADHGYNTNEQYSAPAYSTLASAAAAAAPATYQLPPHSAPPYATTQSYHPTQTYSNAQTYSTQYNAHNYPSSHPYSTRIGL
ncbi:hypothetical protein QFC19_002908 [Naganishia cerealis]|uniref:Uncharacterized protein n=1 Tax=Naganishia cerealis TaxID=610337 RepID=A0ACC2W754_9TREE|nr:hypothetical protein QFC19_002908 [Naganishia cerealis]